MLLPIYSVGFLGSLGNFSVPVVNLDLGPACFFSLLCLTLSVEALLLSPVGSIHKMAASTLESSRKVKTFLSQRWQKHPETNFRWPELGHVFNPRLITMSYTNHGRFLELGAGTLLVKQYGLSWGRGDFRKEIFYRKKDRHYQYVTK